MTASFPNVVTAVPNPVQLYASFDDPLSVRLGLHQFRVPAWMNGFEITELSLSAATAPTGTSVTINARRNGTIFVTATLTVASTSGVAVAPTSTIVVATGDLLRMAISQVDSAGVAAGVAATLIAEPPA